MELVKRDETMEHLAQVLQDGWVPVFFLDMLSPVLALIPTGLHLMNSHFLAPQGIHSPPHGLAGWCLLCLSQITQALRETAAS